MIDAVLDNPATPEFWAANQSGMAASRELVGSDLDAVKAIWNRAMVDDAERAGDLSAFGLHKGLANRRIEADSHITELVTGSDKGFSNFFVLRAHPAAMPEFQVLAYRMLAKYLENKPREIGWGEWHVPHFGGEKCSVLYDGSIDDQIKVATARCARLSYLTQDGEHSPEKDIALHDSLLANRHMSPFEHCAQAVNSNQGRYKRSNFDSQRPCGWLQYRKMIEGENQINADLNAIMKTKPEWISL